MSSRCWLLDMLTCRFHHFNCISRYWHSRFSIPENGSILFPFLKNIKRLLLCLPLVFYYFKSEGLIKFEVELKKFELEVGTGVFFLGGAHFHKWKFFLPEKIVDKSVFPVQFQQKCAFFLG